MINKEEVKKIIIDKWKELDHKQSLLLEEKGEFMTSAEDQKYYEILIQKQAIYEIYNKILDMKEA